MLYFIVPCLVIDENGEEHVVDILVEIPERMLLELLFGPPKKGEVWAQMPWHSQKPKRIWPQPDDVQRYHSAVEPNHGWFFMDELMSQ